MFYAFLDIHPTTFGHTLLIPKKHFKDITDISDEVFSNLNKTLKYLHNYLEEKLGCNGLTIQQNNGIAQEIKHFHIHLIPKYKNKKELNLEKSYELLKMTD